MNILSKISSSCYKGCTAFSSYSRQRIAPNFGKLTIGVISLSTGGIGYWKWNNQQENRLPVSTSTQLPLHYEKIKQIRHEWENKNFYHSNLSKTQATDILFARAEQIKEIYKDTHYVFIHGQSTSLYPLVLLINHEARKQSGKMPFFKHIRMPLSKDYPKSFLEDAIFIAKEGDDHNEYASEHLLSTDLYFPHNSSEESAYYFVKNNYPINPPNIPTVRYMLYQANEKLSADRALEISKHMEHLGKALQSKAPCGNLWVFCIPKSLFQEKQESDIAYRSHPFGQICRCHQGHDVEIIQKIQNNTLDTTTMCNQRPNVEKLPLTKAGLTMSEMMEYNITPIRYPPVDRIPQYRLIIPSMTPEKGVVSFMLTPFSKSQRRSIKQEIQKSIEDPAHTPSVSRIFRKSYLNKLCDLFQQIKL